MPESSGKYAVPVTVWGADGKLHTLHYSPMQGGSAPSQAQHDELRAYLVREHGQRGDAVKPTEPVVKPTEPTEAQEKG